MSNKIILFESAEKNNKNSEIFKDISLFSTCLVKGQYYNTFDYLLEVNNDTDENEKILTVNKSDDEKNKLILITTKSSYFSRKYISDASSSIKKDKSNWKIEKLINLKSIFNSLHNIFHWIPGERIINPEFGSKLYYLLYNGITPFTSEQIISEIKNSITIWEPRVNIVLVINVSNINDTENNTIQLDVIFTVPALDNNKYTYSYTLFVNNK